MFTESSDKYYYRYQISEEEPFTTDSHFRKIQKASQNSTSHLLIDLTKCKNVSGITTHLLSKNHNFFINVLCCPEHFQMLLDIGFQAEHIFVFIENTSQLSLINSKDEFSYFFSPRTTKNLQALISFSKSPKVDNEIYWCFLPHKKNLKNSISLKDIYHSRMNFKTLKGLELFNDQIPSYLELEPLVPVRWSFKTNVRSLLVTVIIPSYNNVTFLSNTLRHLFEQTLPSKNYEIIVVEDGGNDHTCELLKELFSNFADQINLKFIYWPKFHPTRGKQNFFRAGQARNLAVQYCETEKMVFLDSDMIVPNDFLETTFHELKQNQVVQFQRFHVRQELSLLNPEYSQIRLGADTYIEEAAYWSQLFNCESWMNLADFWKYTCTYALGLHRSHFQAVGRFKKYYVSYGFEDTDLGYEFMLRGFKFKLIKKPLFHLTAYDRMQYKNSRFQRLALLRKTSALFYLQHLNPKIYILFGNFYRFEKSPLQTIRDFF